MLAAPLAACTEDDEPPDAQAEALARMLEGGPDGVRWNGGNAPDLAGLLGELAELPRTVGVAGIGETREDGDGQIVDVALDWSWDLNTDGEPDWTYSTSAMLLADEETGWTVVPATAMIAERLSADDPPTIRRTTAERADVLGADDETIVTDRAVLRVGIDKTHLEEASSEELRDSSEAVASLAGLGDPMAFADRVEAAGPRAFVEAIVVREDSDIVDLAAVREIPGGVTIADEIPLAPTSGFARALLGRAGPATAEIIEESDGRVVEGDLTGLSGLQRRYDTTLAGAPGLQVLAGDVVLFELPATPGEELRLTLSVPAQEAAEAALAEIDGPSGLVAIRASTGEILAAASGPGSEGLDTAMRASLAPGSTYKIITALALLRAGVGPGDTVSCTPQATVDGYTISNYPGYPDSRLGEITMTEAIAQSCNTALINAADQLSATAMTEAAEALGLGRELPGDWPGFLGSYPQGAQGTALAASLIGQGEVLASPLAMATVAASVAAGQTVTPRLVLGPQEIADDDARTGVPVAPLTAEESAVLADYMAAVVATGTGILLSDVPGDPVHAKTGSAEAGGGEGARVDSWMIAYQGDVAVAALVEGGGHGSGAAGAIVEDFLRQLP